MLDWVLLLHIFITLLPHTYLSMLAASHISSTPNTTAVTSVPQFKESLDVTARFSGTLCQSSSFVRSSNIITLWSVIPKPALLKPWANASEVTEFQATVTRSRACRTFNFSSAIFSTAAIVFYTNAFLFMVFTQWMILTSRWCNMLVQSTGTKAIFTYLKNDVSGVWGACLTTDTMTLFPSSLHPCNKSFH